MGIFKKDEYGRTNKQTIDLTGPNGNAFAVIGQAKKTARQLDWEDAEIKKLIAEMLASESYPALLKLFDDHFGEYFDLLQ